MLAAFLSVASIFVALTTVEITIGVFGPRLRVGLSLGAPLRAEGECAHNLRGLAAAVERAIAASGSASDERRAVARYREKLLPEWGREEVARATCASEPGGSDAVAVVLRLRLVGEEQARRQAGQLGPIRQDLEAYLGH